MKQTITCEIDIPDEWEFDAIRPFKPGEVFLSAFGKPKVATWSSEVPHIVLRRAFVWPRWLKCAAITKDKNGYWRGHTQIPKLFERECIWHAPGLDRHYLSVDILDIDLPDVPWEKSLRINPNYKAE